MERINTPFGHVSIMIDDKEIEYHAVKLSPDDRIFPDVKGRYRIAIAINPDGREHTISCILPEAADYQSEIESGENLECQSFYCADRYKLFIGLEGDACVLPDGTKDSSYDYDVDYLKNGMVYLLDKNTKTSVYVIGIAWIDDVGWDDHDRGTQTWFAADPTNL